MSRLKKEEIQQFLDGDDSVFPKVFKAYRNRINYLAIEILRNQADCEEVVQNTFIKAIKRRDKLRDAGAFNTWIYRIAYNSCLDIYRRNKRGNSNETGDLSIENYSDKNGDSSDVVRKKAILEAIQEEINHLPSDMKQLCLLRFVGDCSIEEISEIMDIPIGTVKSRLHRAKTKLRQGLSERHVTPAVYMSFLFTPITFKIYSALIRQQEMTPIVESKVMKVIENSTGIATGAAIAGGGFVTGLGVAVVTTTVMLTAFGTYTLLNPIEVDKPVDVVQLTEVDYLKDLTNENLQVVLMFHGTPDEQAIEVTQLKDGKRIPIEAVDADNYAFIVKENGIYKVKYGDFEEDVVIENIDKQSPELTELVKKDGLLKITGSDDLSLIDFEKSYVVEGDNKFDLIRIDDTSAFFKDAVHTKAKLYLYDKVGNYQVYEINVKNIEENTDGQ